uniref:Uncharacterized protein n=1 Tax=Anguilla anguilla TaxID=7936 RepID=A0A0E9V6Y1_ANGAN
MRQTQEDGEMHKINRQTQRREKKRKNTERLKEAE